MHRLPEHYRLIKAVDLMESRMMAFLSLALTAAMVALGFVLGPKDERTVIGFHMLAYLALLLLAIVAYMLLHELIHGVAMQAFSGKKPVYGFNGAAAFAGSDALFTKRQYAVVALLPLLLLGTLLAVLNALLYPALFWFFYILQILNVSGSCGDLYVVLYLLGMPPDTLVTDAGTCMRFYAASEYPRAG